MTTSNSSIPLPKHWKILRPCLPSIVQTSGGDVKHGEPLLYLGNVRFMRESIGASRGTHRMHAEAVDLNIKAGFLPVLSDDVPIQ